MRKFAIVSHALPPAGSGQAIMLHRLLRDLPGDRYCLIGQQNFVRDNIKRYSDPLPGRYYYVPFPTRLTHGKRFAWIGWTHYAAVHAAIAWRARRIAAVLRRERCQAVVACSGGADMTDMPAALEASRIVGVQFYPYFFDHYALQWTGPILWHPIWRGYFSRTIEPRLVREAAGVIVPNEFLADELHRRYGVRPTIVRNPLDLSAYDAADDAKAVPAGGVPGDGATGGSDGPRVVYTGSVNTAHYDSFRDLIAAIEALGRPGLRLHLYAEESPGLLAARGIRGPVVFHDHRTLDRVPAVQKSADVLFLALAFSSPWPGLIRTSAPGKMGEYLAAGRPILVHAPADSFPAYYFRKHDCGLVSDRSSPGGLAAALDRLLSDPALCRRLTANARERARDFDLGVCRDVFLRLVAGVDGPAGAGGGSRRAGVPAGEPAGEPQAAAIG